MNYFATYSYFVNCPTCEGAGDDVYKTDVYDTKQGIINYIKEQCSDTRFWAIYNIETEGHNQGDVTKISTIDYSNYRHNVQKVSFEFDGFNYELNRDKDKFKVTTNNPTEQVLYGEDSGTP